MLQPAPDPTDRTLEALAAAPRFHQWMAEVVSPFTGECVLELGAGIGSLSSLLAPGRRCYVATDAEPKRVAELRSRLSGHKNVHTQVCDFTRREDIDRLRETVSLAAPRDKIDTVICVNVLEHIEDDMAGLRNIHAMLGQGGRVIVLVPEGQSLFGAMDKALGHVRRYSKKELRDRLHGAGFMVEQIIPFNRISRPAWFVAGRILKRRSVERYQMAIFDRFVWLWRRIDKFLPWCPVSIIAIARKP